MRVHKLEWRGYQHLCLASIRDQRCCSKKWNEVTCIACLNLKGKRRGRVPYGSTGR